MACYRIFIVISWIILGNSVLTDFQRPQLMYKFPNLFTLERSSQVQHLFLLFLQDLGFTSGWLRPGEVTWPAWAHPGSCWSWLCQEHQSPNWVAPASPPALERQLPGLAFPLFFKDKLHLPDNIILQLEECQNSNFCLGMPYFGQAAFFYEAQISNRKLLSICRGESLLEVQSLFTKLGWGRSLTCSKEIREMKF